MNRYSYVLNNPLKYTDPSGYYWQKQDPGEGIPAGGNNYDENGDIIRGSGGYKYTNTFGRNVYVPGSNYIGSPGWGENGKGLNGYYYDYYSKQYRSAVSGMPVDYATVYMNAIQPNSIPAVLIMMYKKSPVAPDNYIDQLIAENSQHEGPGMMLEDPPGEGGGIILGQSIDATLAIASLGWTIEGGYYADSKNVEQFVSNGYTVGVEASVGYNLIIIKPKENFKFSDLEGMGASGVINIGMISIGILGNSSVGYPENSVFDTYYGIKIGIGAGGGGSYTPKSNTSFFYWIPDITKSSFHWK